MRRSGCGGGGGCMTCSTLVVVVVVRWRGGVGSAGNEMAGIVVLQYLSWTVILPRCYHFFWEASRGEVMKGEVLCNFHEF